MQQHKYPVCTGVPVLLVFQSMHRTQEIHQVNNRFFLLVPAALCAFTFFPGCCKNVFTSFSISNFNCSTVVRDPENKGWKGKEWPTGINVLVFTNKSWKRITIAFKYIINFLFFWTSLGKKKVWLSNCVYLYGLMLFLKTCFIKPVQFKKTVSIWYCQEPQTSHWNKNTPKF